MNRTHLSLISGLFLWVILLPCTAQDPLLDAYYGGNYEEVIRMSGENLARGDSSFNQYYLQALSQAQLGRTGQAAATLERACLQFPEEISLRKLLAKQYFDAGAYLKADSLYTSFVGTDSTDLSSWLKLAEIASDRQDYKTSIERLHQALELDTTNLEGLMLIGDVLTRKDDSTATLYYQRALHLYPDNQQTAYALANWDLRLDKPLKAVMVCEQILRKDSMNIRFLKLMGFSLYRGGKPHDAIEHLEKAADLGDSTTFTYKYLGISKYMTMDFPGAIPPLETAVQKDSVDADTQFFLGASLATTTRKEEAMSHFEKALELMQPDPAAIAKIYAEQGNLLRLDMKYEAAYDRYRMSWEADTTQPIQLYYMASILDNSLHHSKQALVDYQRFLDQLDRLPSESPKNNQIPSVRDIVEDRIVQLKEELFLRDEQ
ncbi:MAG: tetratricopeptide repeat protein [Bacteroidales bacterium]